ncbi:MAG: flavin reductase [Bacteroidota bacterium]
MEQQGYKEISAKEIPDNVIHLIADDWMLVTSGDSSSFNTMTASWGGFGNIWNKPVAFIFIRPERYTYGFLENNQSFTLSFFDHMKFKDDLMVCGTKSGRDGNKLVETSLTSMNLPEGYIAFSQARLIIACKIIYRDKLSEDIIPEDVKNTFYKSGGFHEMFFGEITSVWIKNE